MIEIDSEFEQLLPPLSDETYKNLEKSIVEQGYRDWEPIITWKEKTPDGRQREIVVDGHNRYHICDKHGIEYTTHEMEFNSRNEAKIWALENQTSRRNLNEYDTVIYVTNTLGPLYAAAAKQKHDDNGGDRGNQHTGGKLAARQKSDAPPNVRTDDRIADTASKILNKRISRDKVRKIQTIEAEAKKGNDTAIKARDDVRSGDKSINNAYLDVRPKGNKADARRICTICGKPIDKGDCYESHPGMHRKCRNEQHNEYRRKQRKSQREQREPKRTESNITIGNVNEVIEHDTAELKRQLLLDARGAWGNIQATLSRYESMGVSIPDAEADGIGDAMELLIKAIQEIKES